MFLFQKMINALNVVFTVMKKIVANADVLDLKNGKRKKKLKIIVQNVVNENRISWKVKNNDYIKRIGTRADME